MNNCIIAAIKKIKCIQNRTVSQRHLVLQCSVLGVHPQFLSTTRLNIISALVALFRVIWDRVCLLKKYLSLVFVGLMLRSTVRHHPAFPCMRSHSFPLVTVPLQTNLGQSASIPQIIYLSITDVYLKLLIKVNMI